MHFLLISSLRKATVSSALLWSTVWAPIPAVAQVGRAELGAANVPKSSETAIQVHKRCRNKSSGGLFPSFSVWGCRDWLPRDWGRVSSSLACRRRQQRQRRHRAQRNKYAKHLIHHLHNHVSFTRRIPSCLEVHRRKRLDIRNTDVHLLRYVWLVTAVSPHGQAEMQVRG